MLRVLQCVAPRGWLSSVCTMTLSTFASSILCGTPGRGSSSNPSTPRSTKRRRHLPTVCTVTRSRAATALLLKPEEQPNTMRARNAKACAVLRRRVSPSKIPAASADSSILATGRPVRTPSPHPDAIRLLKLSHEFPAQHTSLSLPNTTHSRSRTPLFRLFYQVEIKYRQLLQ